ncbi:hypothetical protein J3E64_002991 [Sphingobium sp. OAS761]|nr:hypothetical protein [Sphingobium sp. OAS761]
MHWQGRIGKTPAEPPIAHRTLEPRMKHVQQI